LRWRRAKGAPSLEAKVCHIHNAACTDSRFSTMADTDGFGFRFLFWDRSRPEQWLYLALFYNPSSPYTDISYDKIFYHGEKFEIEFHLLN